MDVSCHWLDDGGVAFDPLLPAEGIEWFRSRPQPPQAVLLSNRHHYRQAAEFAAPVWASRPGMHEFEGSDREVRAFDFGDELPGGAVAVEIGGICPDETAFFLPEKRAILFADGFVQGPGPGEPVLGFVPDSMMDDPPQTKAKLLEAYARALDELEFDHVLMAHGLPLIGDGREKLQAFVDAGGRTAFEMG
jgi:hypothetical protein